MLVVCNLTDNTSQVLNRSLIDRYVDCFNRLDDEMYSRYIPNSQAKEFLSKNIPLFECPDKTLEEIYYYRWWTFRKHLTSTPDGFIITEFLPDVPWAGKYNGISCPAWFHFREGRWLHDSTFLKDYANYWLKGGGALRSYSFPVTDALYQFSLVMGDNQLLKKYYPELKENYSEWKKEKYDEKQGLFWQIDDRDGMEVSIGGSGYRATINSYMYAEAHSLSLLADEMNEKSSSAEFAKDAKTLKYNLCHKLWDEKDLFFKVLPQSENAQLKEVRELHGYTPWTFEIPDEKFAAAWKFLMDSKHFFAPYGLTTAEQSHPGFTIAYEGHECQWNGPSWPFATSMTLTGLANLLNTQNQKYISKYDYYTLLSVYAKSQHRYNEKGELIPWIDENLNPYTGDWISRTLLLERQQKPKERGCHYNHSSFCDLVISGLIGLCPQKEDVLIVNPLIPNGIWEYFCLDNVLYHGKIITILYDKTGKKYNKGKGFAIYIDGRKRAQSPDLCRLEVKL